MTTFLAILITIACLSLSGMFYWMYKSKEGELDLSKDAWHFKLVHYMWETELWELRNACPYYWSIVSTILLLPLYLPIRYLLVAPITWISDKIKSVPSLNLHINTPKIFQKIPKFNIPDSKKQWYRYIYTKSEYLLRLLFKLIFFTSLIVVVIYPLIVVNTLWLAIIASSVMLITFLTIMVHIFLPEYDKHHWDHYANFFISLGGICFIPFKLIGELIKLILSPIGNFYQNNCPPINWK